MYMCPLSCMPILEKTPVLRYGISQIPKPSTMRIISYCIFKNNSSLQAGIHIYIMPLKQLSLGHTHLYKTFVRQELACKNKYLHLEWA